MARLSILLFFLLALLLSGFPLQPPTFLSRSPNRPSTIPAPSQFNRPGSYRGNLLGGDISGKIALTENQLKTIGIEINGRLGDAGDDWRGILSIYSTEHARFNHVNWATTLSKLGRIRGSEIDYMKQSDGFRDLLNNLSRAMTASPELKEFGGERQVASIVYALAKMRATGNDDVSAIMRIVEADAEWLVEGGMPQTIANTAWAFATLNTAAPLLFKKIEERAAFLVENGNLQDIATTTWAFATLNTPAPILFKKIEERASFLVENGKPKEIANIALAFAKLNTPAPILFKKIEERASFLVKKGNGQTIGMLGSAFSLLNYDVPAQFAAFLSRPGHYSKNVSEEASNLTNSGALSPKQLKAVNIDINQRLNDAGDDWRGILSVYTAESARFNHMNWSATLSKLGRIMGRDAASMKSVKLSFAYRDLIHNLSRAMVASPKLEKFGDARAVSNIVHALAKMQATGDDVNFIMQAVEANAEWLVGNQNTQEIANTAWAFAKLHAPAPALFKKIEARASYIVENGDPQEIANTAWAFAKLNTSAPILFAKIEERASFLVENGKTQEVANTAWAFATLQAPGPTLFKKIEERAIFIVMNAKPQETAMLAWAFALYSNHASSLFEKISAPTLFKKIEERASYLVENGNPHSIANTAWAFAKLNTPAPILFDLIEERAPDIIVHANSEEMALLMLAFAKKQHAAPALCFEVDSRSEFFIHTGTHQNIASTAMAFAELGILPISFFGCLEESADKFLESASQQSVCNTCWSLAVLDLARAHEPLLQLLWGKAMKIDAAVFTDDNLSQLVQTKLHARSSGVELSPPEPPALRLRMAEAAEVTDSIEGIQESEYSALLTEMGFRHERQVCPWKEAGRMFAIDIACPVRKIAVELDGGFHFLNSGRENGRTVAKRRLLESSGWKVVNIPYQVDNKMSSREFLERHKTKGDGKELKKLFLKRLLREKAGLELLG
jgi:hypothetical protein